MGLERNPLKYQSDALLGEKRPGSPVAHIPPVDRDVVGHGQELLGEKLPNPTGRVLRPGDAEKGRGHLEAACGQAGSALHIFDKSTCGLETSQLATSSLGQKQQTTLLSPEEFPSL